MKKPTPSQSLALEAAKLARSNEEQEGNDAPDAVADDEVAASAHAGDEAPVADTTPKSRGGRPRGRRPVAARQTLYLDEKRHEALANMAEDRGRSIHSLIIEGVDHVIGKPNRAGWRDNGGTKPLN